MKFNDIYSEASSYYNDVDPYVVELGRRLMQAAKTMPADKEKDISGKYALVGGMLANHDGNDARLLNKLKKHGISANDLVELMRIADEELPPFSASDIPDPKSQDGEEENDFEKPEKMQGEGVFDKDGILGKFVSRDMSTNITTGKPFDQAKLFGLINVMTRDDKIESLKGLIKMAQQNSGKPGSGYKKGAPTIDMVPKLRAELEKLEKEAAMQGGGIDEGSNYQDGISVIQHLEGIVRDKQTKAVPFMDGKGKVDMFTASAVTKVFDALDDEKQRKMLNMIGTRTGFLKIAKFAMEQVGRTESMEEDNHDPSDHGEYAEREMAETQLEFIKYACEEIDEHLQQFPMPEWFQNKLSGVHETMTKLHAYIEGQEGKMGLNDNIEEGKKKGGKDGKACWDGYYLAGTKMKGGKEVDDCRPRKKPKKK